MGISQKKILSYMISNWNSHKYYQGGHVYICFLMFRHEVEFFRVHVDLTDLDESNIVYPTTQ